MLIFFHAVLPQRADEPRSRTVRRKGRSQGAGGTVCCLFFLYGIYFFRRHADKGFRVSDS